MAATPPQGFTRLSSSVFLHAPAITPPAGSQNPPTVLICSWLSASFRHIEKYTAGYQTLFPTSRLLLITCNPRDFVLPFTGPLRPALDVLHPDESLLVHAFSNGGCHQLIALAALFRKQHAKKIPIRGLVLDSCPGTMSYLRACEGFVSSLATLPWWRRWIATVAVYVFFALQAFLRRLLGMGNPIAVVREGLNDATLLGGKGVRRCYIFGNADEVVRNDDVVDHIVDARRLGYTVQAANFDGTPHVAHIRGQEKRYWDVVRACWTGEGWKIYVLK